MKILVIVSQPLPANLPLDGHNDLSVYIRYAYNNNIYGGNFTTRFERGGLGQHVDLSRLKDGKVGGTFWVAFTFCPKNSLDFSDENYRESMSLFLHGYCRIPFAVPVVILWVAFDFDLRS